MDSGSSISYKGIPVRRPPAINRFLGSTPVSIVLLLGLFSIRLLVELNQWGITGSGTRSLNIYIAIPKMDFSLES